MPTPTAPGTQGSRDPGRPPQRTGGRGRDSASHQTPLAMVAGHPPGDGPPDPPHGGRTAQSQVGGNRHQTAPPQARQTEQGTGAGHAEGHRPRGTALPAPSAGTARGAHATPPRGGGSGRRGSASADIRKGHAGTTRRATGPSSRNAQTAWNGVPASEGKGHPDRTGRHTQRGTRGVGRGKRERHNSRYLPGARWGPVPERNKKIGKTRRKIKLLSIKTAYAKMRAAKRVKTRRKVFRREIGE